MEVQNCSFSWALNLRTKGLLKTLELAMSKVLVSIGLKKKIEYRFRRGKGQAEYKEVLNLKPGELVEVKSEQEIWATLKSRRNKGLYLMKEMRKLCGKRFRVYKRLEKMMLEDSGEFRKVKNTVLLDGVMCDGEEPYGCDRSCFHFWREAWLRRVKER